MTNSKYRLIDIVLLAASLTLISATMSFCTKSANAAPRYYRTVDANGNVTVRVRHGKRYRHVRLHRNKPVQEREKPVIVDAVPVTTASVEPKPTLVKTFDYVVPLAAVPTTTVVTASLGPPTFPPTKIPNDMAYVLAATCAVVFITWAAGRSGYVYLRDRKDVEELRRRRNAHAIGTRAIAVLVDEGNILTKPRWGDDYGGCGRLTQSVGERSERSTAFGAYSTLIRPQKAGSCVN